MMLNLTLLYVILAILHVILGFTGEITLLIRVLLLESPYLVVKSLILGTFTLKLAPNS